MDARSQLPLPGRHTATHAPAWVGEGRGAKGGPYQGSHIAPFLFLYFQLLVVVPPPSCFISSLLYFNQWSSSLFSYLFQQMALKPLYTAQNHLSFLTAVFQQVALKPLYKFKSDPQITSTCGPQAFFISVLQQVALKPLYSIQKATLKSTLIKRRPKVTLKSLQQQVALKPFSLLYSNIHTYIYIYISREKKKYIHQVPISLSSAN